MLTGKDRRCLARPGRPTSVVLVNFRDFRAVNFPCPVVVSLPCQLPCRSTSVVPVNFRDFAFQPDASLLYAVALAGVGPDTLSWAGAGPGSTMVLFGQTFSPDFPGVPAPGLLTSGGPSLFVARLRP